MNRTVVATVMFFVAAVQTSSVAHQLSRQSSTLPAIPSCRHGEGGQATDAVRRQKALDLARTILRAEADKSQKTGRYEALAALTNLGPTPEGFQLRLQTDGQSFVFSLKDGTDPCQFAIFSDQDGVIYQDSPRAMQMAF
jgi:hypothetical protein